MKKFISGLLIGFLLATAGFGFANSQVRLVLNGVDITNEIVSEYGIIPTIVDGRTIVSARALAEKLGATVEWDEENKAVLITSDTAIIQNVDIVIESKPFTSMNALFYRDIPYFSLKNLGILAEAKGMYVEYHDDSIEIEGVVYSSVDALSVDCRYYSIELLPAYYQFEDNTLFIYWLFNR